ncbi:MAG TPA: glycosyltransferase [Acidimicrobiales bacterium]|nr:glycosyltransferase [Acidimicrobiales bacterium]
MKVAIYHNLPPGGALRVLTEFLRRTSEVHDYDLYSVDMGRADVFADARPAGTEHELSQYVSSSFRYPLFRGVAGRMPLGKLLPLEAVRRIATVEREIAADIDRRGYDVVLVHPCQLVHTPSLLRWLSTPSVHLMQEVRRQSFEAGYRPPVEVKSVASLPRWVSTRLMERTLRRRDVLAAAAADRIVCNSCYSAEAIQRAYGRAADVCYPGVDGDVFDTGDGHGHGHGVGVGVEDDVAPRPHAALSVGALDPVKGHDLVVRALSRLAPDERPVLHVVFERCDDAYRRELVSLAGSTGVDLRLHRGIDDAALARLYRSCAVTVVAARLEPFGLVPLESLACGTPVVGVREAGYRETIQSGVNGYLVERAATDIAEAVRRVLRGGLMTSPGALRRTVVPGWDWDSFVKRQCEILAATASGAGR